MATASENTPLLALRDATIFTGEAMIENHALLIENSKVKDIVQNTKIPASARPESWARHILVPGFIDTQVNGGGNVFFNTEPTPDSCIKISKAHQKYGTTRLLVTFISDEPGRTRQAIAAVRDARQKHSGILGIHIEGPHLSIEKRGIHNSDYIRALTIDDMASYKKRAADEIIMITVAPENVTPEQVRELCQSGVIVSIGHSAAEAEQVYAFLAAGATCFTHLFNGMGGMSARAPGVSGVALDDGKSWCGLIVDGYHVSPEMVRLAIHAKAHGKMILVSDAMPPSATDKPEPFVLYEEAITAKNKCCINRDGCLAGSGITLSDAVMNCIDLGIDVGEALRMASAYPASFLGLSDRHGMLIPGYVADIVALDHHFSPQRVWIDGHELR